MSGPAIQGSIIIRTDSVSEAIRKVSDLQKNVSQFSQSATGGTKGVNEAIERTVRAYGQLDRQVKQNSQEMNKQSELIARAANRFAQFEASVRSSNASQSQQADLLTRAAAQLKGYESAVRDGAVSGQRLSSVNTELSVAYSQLQRDLNATNTAAREEARAKEQAQRASEANLNTLSRSNVQYERVVAALRRANLETNTETQTVREVEQAHRNLQSVLQNSASTRQEVNAAQRQFNETLGRANITAQTGQMRAANEATMNWQNEMRNLSTSVVVALGPLSGFASRLTALTTLFNRNAVEMATVFTALTGFSVLLARASQVGKEAEQQIFRLNAQLENLGAGAQVTSGDLEYMAHAVAAATMTSAKEARQASGVLLEFGGIARNQFQDVLIAAQGMSTVFGGTLAQNARRLGRAIEDPVSGLTRLEQQGIILDEATKDHIQTLVSQGRQYQATAVLLKQLTSLQNAAQAETKGLAGAYDTLSGNLDILFQELFVGSGAIDAAAANISTMADAVREFTNTEFAQVLGQVFRAIMQVSGRGLTFLIENMDKLAAVVTAVAFSVIPKLIATTLNLTVALAAKTKGTLSAALAMFRYSAATDTATRSTLALTTALLANPFVRAAMALGGLVAAMWQYNRAVDGLTSGQSLGERIERDIDVMIEMNRRLTKEQADQFREQGQVLVDAANEQESSLEKIQEGYENLVQKVRDTRSLMQRLNFRDSVIDEMARQFAVAGELSGNMAYRFNLLTKEQQDLVRALAPTKAVLLEVSNALEEVDSRAKDLSQTISTTEAADFVRDLAEEFEALQGTLNEMEFEIFPDMQALNKLEEQERTVLSMISLMEDLASEGAVYTDEMSRLQRLLAEIRKQKQDIAEIEMSREAQRLVDRAREAVIELQKMNDIMSSGGDPEGLIEDRYEIEAIVAALQELQSVEIRAIADELGSPADIRSVAEAIVQTERASVNLRTATDDQIKAQEELEKQFASIRRELNPLTAQMEGVAFKMDVLQRMLTQASTQQARDEILALMEVLAQASLEIGESLEEFDWTGYGRTIDEIANYTTDSFTSMTAELGSILTQMGVEVSTTMAQTIVGIGGAMDGMMNLMESANRQSGGMYQAFAIAQATMAGAIAISKALAEGGPIMGPVMASITAANVGAQIASIKAQQFATGGYVSGPGSATSDSVPAWLSNGEYVMQASAVRALGIGTLDALNEGRATPFATGGVVGVPTFSNNSSTGVNVTINDYSSGTKDYETESYVDSNGIQNLRLTVRDIVKDTISRGEVDREMGGRYGLRTTGRRV